MFDLQIGFSDFIGCLGALLVLVAYVLLQIGKMNAETFSYSFLNLIAAVMILISLMYAWNLPAALMEIAWIGISFFGIFKYFQRQRVKIINRP